VRKIIFIGYDRREGDAFAVAVHSIRRRLNEPIPIRGMLLSEAQRSGVYRRPTVRDGNHLVDLLSVTDDYDGRLSTEHANLRFLVPHIADADCWAMFADSDILARADVSQAFDDLDPTKALYCVKHDYAPTDTVKMDGQEQTAYPRKNWSSVMIFNCVHPSNRGLTLELINTVPGRDLHRFCWLGEEEIGELDPSWNWLVGHSDVDIDPHIVHFTTGLPSMPGYENVEYADEWREELTRAIQRP
jgi:hypothetical protein